MMECPRGGISIEIEQINCGIFRCGILKSNNEQIPPHLSKEECGGRFDLWLWKTI